MARDAEAKTNDAKDRRAEAAILSRIIPLHPTRLTGRELLLNLALGDASALTRERYEPAIGELVTVGLLRTEGVDPPAPVPPCASRRSRDDRPARCAWSPDPHAEDGLRVLLGENIRLFRARIY